MKPPKLIKAQILTLCLWALSATAFGQAFITFDNWGRPVTLGSHVYPQDAPFANQPVPTLGDSGFDLPSGHLINMALYAGTTSGSETLITTQPLSAFNSPSDGEMPLWNMRLQNFPPMQLTYFIVYAYDATYQDQQSALLAGTYWGTSGEFTAIPGSLTPRSISNPAQSNSTWPQVPLVLIVPEPGVAALATLGAMTMLLRSKRSR